MIRLLSPELCSQIAAGEVVERPASAVKELIDNAIDAGARRVLVEALAGGRRLIRVSDDGSGMTPTEARLAMQRHATSKLARIEDLHTLTTHGFRGEALPAIAAVARFALVTRVAGALAGFRLEVEAGVPGETREVGAPPGTTVEVRDLYYNVPARLKFLRSEATEAGHVADVVLRAAMAHPEVHLRLTQGGRVQLDALPVGELGERVRALLGPRLAARLWETPAPREDDPVRVRAFLAPPDEALASARGVLLFVGRRAVRDRGLLGAVTQAYHGLCAPGRHPQVVLFVEVAGAEVDVNVHPQKAEVRFARPGDVYAAVRHTLALAIADAGWAEAPDASARGQTLTLALGDPEPDPEPAAAPTAARALPAQLALASLEVLSVLEEAFLLCGGPGELVLVDLAAARVAIAESRLRAAYQAGRLRPQRLLFPRVAPADPAMVSSISVHGAELLRCGFELEAAAPTALAVRAAPADLAGDPGVAALAVLAALARGADIFAPLAAGAAVAAAPGAGEARQLLEDLERVDWRRAGARPIVVRVALAELLRRFGPR